MKKIVLLITLLTSLLLATAKDDVSFGEVETMILHDEYLSLQIHMDTKIETSTNSLWLNTFWYDIGTEVSTYEGDRYISSLTYTTFDGEPGTITKVVTYDGDLPISLNVISETETQVLTEYNYIYTYNSMNKIGSVERYYLTGGGANQTLTLRDTYSYTDDDEILLGSLREIYDTNSGGMRNYRKATATINSDNKYNSLEVEQWDGTAWIGGEQWEINYNSSNLLTSIYISISLEGTPYQPYALDTFTYNEDGFYTLYQQKLYIDGEYVSSLRGTPSYDDENRVISNLLQRFVDGEFTNFFKTESTYPTSNIAEGNRVDHFNLTTYPNPFNPKTSISFNLNKSSRVELKVFDVAGREIRNLISDNLSQGSHTISFNGEGLKSGVYFLRLNVDGVNSVRKVVLTK
jgi:hypothetical protein